MIQNKIAFAQFIEQLDQQYRKQKENTYLFFAVSTAATVWFIISTVFLKDRGLETFLKSQLTICSYVLITVFYFLFKSMIPTGKKEKAYKTLDRLHEEGTTDETILINEIRKIFE